MEGMKIGEAAERTGLSIRTIRHYDELELVVPSGRSPGGFRLYSPADVDRLLLIRRMKPLEFSLEEMRDFLRATDLLGGAAESAAAEELADARATVAWVREETGARLAKLRKKVGYAEEFLGLLGTLPGAGAPDRA